MALILGIETSCDETGVSVFDSTENRILSNTIFSQIKLHEVYGGVVPEIASRSQLEKINIIVEQALAQASVTLDDIGTIAVTSGPGLVGSLLIGICFAKAIAWSKNKKLIGVNHLEAHVFSSFLNNDFSCRDDIPFPHICLAASGGHTAVYLVEDFGKYKILGETIDDAAGEAFDKIAKVLGFGYPGGAVIEKLASQVQFTDFFSYPRTKNKNKELFFSFSGLKTAVLYHLVKLGAYDLEKGVIEKNMTPELKQQVASSLLVCITDIFKKNLEMAFKKYPEVKAFTFVGGVACNKYMKSQMGLLGKKYKKHFVSPSPQFCTDNAAMISFVGGYKSAQGLYSDLTLDVFR